LSRRDGREGGIHAISPTTVDALDIARVCLDRLAAVHALGEEEDITSGEVSGIKHELVAPI
jgi:hypothetical protein